MADLVNHPPHYMGKSIECIHVIEEALGPEGFKGYLRGNALKYLFRCDKKENMEQDVAKAAWYINRLHTVIENERRGEDVV